MPAEVHYPVHILCKDNNLQLSVFSYSGFCFSLPTFWGYHLPNNSLPTLDIAWVSTLGTSTSTTHLTLNLACRVENFFCSTHMHLKFVQVIYFKMPTIVGILKCITWTNDIDLSKKIAAITCISDFDIYVDLKFQAHWVEFDKGLISSGPGKYDVNVMFNQTYSCYM